MAKIKKTNEFEAEEEKEKKSRVYLESCRKQLLKDREKMKPKKINLSEKEKEKKRKYFLEKWEKAVLEAREKGAVDFTEYYNWKDRYERDYPKKCY